MSNNKSFAEYIESINPLTIADIKSAIEGLPDDTQILFSIPDQFLIFKQYDHLSLSEVSDDSIKNEKMKRFVMAAGFFSVLLYLKVKGK